MPSTGETKLQPIKLPWHYSTYKILAILMLIPLLAITAWEFTQSINFRFLIGVVIGVPAVTLAAYSIIRTCSELEKGKVPTITKWITPCITPHTPPQKIHRLLLSTLLIQSLFMELIHSPTEPILLGVSWLSWLLLALSLVGLGIGLSTRWIPDQPPPQEQ